jgi:ABC-2 type transport system ATP-binding protein
MEEKKNGKTILMSSHNFEEVEKNCDTLGIIRQGEMVCVEDIHSLLAKKRKNYTLTFASADEANKFVQSGKFSTSPVSKVIVDVKQIENLNTLIKELSTYHLLDIQSENYTLENLFMQYYGGNKA